MKDCLEDATLDGFLDELCQGSHTHGESLHAGAAFFGFEEGLFVRADRPTYLNFVRLMGDQRQVRRHIEWRHLNGRIASACLVESNGPDRRVSFLTLMCFDSGWKIMSQTFEAATGGAP